MNARGNTLIIPRTIRGAGNTAGVAAAAAAQNAVNPYLLTYAAGMENTPQGLVETAKKIAIEGGTPELDAAKLDRVFIEHPAPCALFTDKVYFADVNKVGQELGMFRLPIEGTWVPRDPESGEPEVKLRGMENGIQPAFLCAYERYGDVSLDTDADGKFWSYNLIFPCTSVEAQALDPETGQPRFIRVGDHDEPVWEEDSALAPALVFAMDARLDRENVFRFEWSSNLYQVRSGGRYGRVERHLLNDAFGGPGWQNLTGRMLRIARHCGFPIREQRVNAASRAELREQAQQRQWGTSARGDDKPAASNGRGGQGRADNSGLGE